MKKLTAAILAVILLVLPAGAVHDHTAAQVWMNHEQLHVCFDTVIFNYPDRDVTQMEKYGVSDGSAQNVINSNPIYLDGETGISCRGWAGIRDDVSSAVIVKYGYKINDGEPVFYEDSVYGAEQAVHNAGGDSRFHVLIPVEGIEKPALLTVTSLGSDGNVYDLIEFTVNGSYYPSGEEPVSPFEHTLTEPDPDGLSLVIDGGTEALNVRPGDTVKAKISFAGDKPVSSASFILSYDPDLSLKDVSFPTSAAGDTANADTDHKTHTSVISWQKQNGAAVGGVLAELTFNVAGDVKKGDFLHISADILECSADCKVINGGAAVTEGGPAGKGDLNVDGEINNKDVVLLFKYVSGDSGAVRLSEHAADVNNDGNVNNKDVVLLFRAASGAAELDNVYDEKTLKASNIRSWTFNDGAAGAVIGVYCETEPDSEVLVCDKNGRVILRENTLDKYFYGRYILPAHKSSETVYFYVKTEGKDWSEPSAPVTLTYTGGGGNALIAHDSHVFYNQYRAHYNGSAVIGGSAEQQAQQLSNAKNFLTAQLGRIRQATGKNTKIIIAVCTNPATVYHDVQYSEEEGGWGDHYEPTSYTQLADYMKDSEDVYVLDMRELFEQNKDRLLFMQADSHWTSVAAYYAYYRAAQAIKKDFPATKIYDLDKDFNVEIVPGGGDLLGFMGAGGVRAANASVTRKSEDMRAPSTAPTAYVMGDSYFWAMSGYLDLLFSRIYLNEPASNPPLYDYTLSDLQTKKPDYLLYIWTERNIDSGLGMIFSAINAGNIR